jgi:hypothetical protein
MLLFYIIDHFYTCDEQNVILFDRCLCIYNIIEYAYAYMGLVIYSNSIVWLTLYNTIYNLWNIPEFTEKVWNKSLTLILPKYIFSM